MTRDITKQVKYAELLFRTVPIAVVSVDKDRKITRWNKIAEEITGYSARDVIGHECSRVLHGVGFDDCHLCSNACDSPLINERCEVVTKDGQVRHVLKSIAVLKDEFGEISEKLECFEDITEMIDLQAELRESKETYSAIVNNAPQVMVIHKNGILKFVNDAGRKVLGYKEEDYIGLHFKDFMTDNSLVIVNAALRERIEGIVSAPYEIELIKNSGEIINVLLKATDITFDRETATLAVMIDITETKQLNAKLRSSEEQFKRFAETVNEIFMVSDTERILYVSPAYEKITGSPCQALLDNPHSLLNLIHTTDRKRMGASFSKSFRNMNEVTNEEFRIIRLDGKMRWLWLQSYPIQDNTNSKPLKATSIVDISDRKKAEYKLLERDRQNQRELLLAARVQKDSLPNPFEDNLVRVSTFFEPYSTVSGDFFNYKWFEEGKKLCGYIIDVSGHGVATALQTATFKMMLDNDLLNGGKIEENAIRAINQKVMDYLYEGSFIALLYFEFDLPSGLLKLISAGITLFLAARPQDCLLVPLYGSYLGIVDDPEINMETIPLKAGEIYYLMSDGASDLIEMYGISKQENSGKYMEWFKKLAASPDRNDDFSVIGIEILQEYKEMKILEIQNDEDLERAQVIISKFLEKNAGSYAMTLEVAVNEALNNGFRASGRVLIKLKRIGRSLMIRVKDDGVGFNPKGESYQTIIEMNEEESDELLEAEGGRGIYLMKLFCDKVIYNAKGNEVLLVKNLC